MEMYPNCVTFSNQNGILCHVRTVSQIHAVGGCEAPRLVKTLEPRGLAARELLDVSPGLGGLAWASNAVTAVLCSGSTVCAAVSSLLFEVEGCERLAQSAAVVVHN